MSVYCYWWVRNYLTHYIQLNLLRHLPRIGVSCSLCFVCIICCLISTPQTLEGKLQHRLWLWGFIFAEMWWFHLSSLFLISLECAAQSSNCMHAPLRPRANTNAASAPNIIYSIHNKRILSLFIQFAFSKALRSAVAAARQHMQLSAMHMHIDQALENWNKAFSLLFISWNKVDCMHIINEVLSDINTLVVWNDGFFSVSYLIARNAW